MKPARATLLILFWLLCCACLLVRILRPDWFKPLFAAHIIGQAGFLYVTLRPNCRWSGPVTTTFETGRRELWLTIDDGPDPATTPHILELLAAHGVKATFFVIGECARQNPELIRAIVGQGHTLGNHTLTHPAKRFWSCPPWTAEREISGCDLELRSITGCGSKLFRAPVGMANPFVHRAVASHGMKLIGWNARGYDATRTDTERIVADIMAGVRPGGIVLLHERGAMRGMGTGGNAAVTVLEVLLTKLRADGFTFVIPKLAVD